MNFFFSFRLIFLLTITTVALLFNACEKSPEELERDLYTYYNRGLEFYERGYFVKAKEFLTNALRAEEKLGTEERKGDIHLFLGLIAFEESEFNLSLAHYAEAKELFRKRLNRRREAMVENNTGNVYSATGKYNTAIEHYRNSFNISRLAADKEGEAIANMNTGYAYFDAGFYDKAFDYFSRAYNDYELLSKPDGEISASIKLGEVYRTTGASDDALRMFNFAKETADYYNHHTFLPEIYNNLGLTYFKLGDIQSAISAYNDGYELLTTSFSDVIMKWSILVNLGDIYFTQSRFARAIETYQKGLAVSDETGESLNNSFINLKIAQTFFIKGVMEENQNDINTAKQLLNSLIKFFDEVKYKPGLINAHSGIAAIYYFQNDSKQLSSTLNKINDLLKESSYEIKNRFTLLYSLSPEIFSFGDFFNYYIVLEKYNGLLNAGFLADENRINHFIYNQATFDFGNETKNNEADKLLYLQREIDFTIFEIVNESAKHSNRRDRKRLDYFSNKYKELKSVISKPSLFDEVFLPGEKLTSGEMQKRLNDNELLINYFFSVDSVYILALSKDNIVINKKSFSIDGLSENINLLQNYINRNNRTESERILSELYNSLIKPLGTVIGNYNKLLVNTNNIQYGLSEYIPFHALIDENGKYLFEKNSVSYYGGIKSLSNQKEINRTAVIENKKESRLSISSVPEGFTLFDSSVPNAKKKLKEYNPVNIISLTPVYFNIDDSYNSYFELFSDTAAAPSQNLMFGEFSSLPLINAAFLNYNKEISSSSRYFAALIPSAKKIVINKFQVNRNGIDLLSGRLINNLTTQNEFNTIEIYSSEKDKNLYWVSLFEYVKL